MIDALDPFVTELHKIVEDDPTMTAGEAWAKAAPVATEAARATAQLVPKIGRARPLAERSVGTPDAGATSMGMIINALSSAL